MEKWLDSILRYTESGVQWLVNAVTAPGFLSQLLLIIGAGILGYLVTPWLKRISGNWLGRHPYPFLQRVGQLILLHLRTLMIFVFLWLGFEIFKVSGLPLRFAQSVLHLILAWVVIAITSEFTTQGPLKKFLTITIWTLAALSILDLIDPLTEALDGIAFQLGQIKISLYSLLKAAILLVVMLWAASGISKIVERRLEKTRVLTPSLQVLITKSFRITLFIIIGLMTLGSVGVDLSTLAVLSGAIGVGIGFGLQKIVSNLVSGFILLLDKSVKPGDVIKVEDTFGWVTSLGARYTSVITRDGMEHLIPNETFITEPVVNWSFSNNHVRISMDIGIHYNSDVDKAIEVCLEAARENERVVRPDDCTCFIGGFGDNSVDLKLFAWIQDPKNGIANAKGDIFLAIWHKFKKHGIEIPYPQRDLHIKSMPKDIPVVDSA